MISEAADFTRQSTKAALQSSFRGKLIKHEIVAV